MMLWNEFSPQKLSLNISQNNISVDWGIIKPVSVNFKVSILIFQLKQIYIRKSCYTLYQYLIFTYMRQGFGPMREKWVWVTSVMPLKHCTSLIAVQTSYCYKIIFLLLQISFSLRGQIASVKDNGAIPSQPPKYLFRHRKSPPKIVQRFFPLCSGREKSRSCGFSLTLC